MFLCRFSIEQINLFQKENGGGEHEYLMKTEMKDCHTKKAGTTCLQDKVDSPYCADAMGEIPWIDPLHISLEMLCFPLQCTLLYSPPVSQAFSFA
jgi:hypothetical protein